MSVNVNHEIASLSRDVLVLGKYHFHLALRNAAYRYFSRPCPYCNTLDCLVVFSRRNDPTKKFMLPDGSIIRLQIGRIKYCRGEEYVMIPSEAYFPTMSDIIIFTALRRARSNRVIPSTSWKNDYVRQSSPQFRNTLCNALACVVSMKRTTGHS